MFPSISYPIYTIKPKYWLVRDEPVYIEKDSQKNLLFQISSESYIPNLVARLQFFQETIRDRKTSPEMRIIQLRAMKTTLKELLYIEKNYRIVPKDSKQSE